VWHFPREFGNSMVNPASYIGKIANKGNLLVAVQVYSMVSWSELGIVTLKSNVLKRSMLLFLKK